MDVADLEHLILLLNILQGILNVILIVKSLKYRRKCLRRWWVKPHLQPALRDRYGMFETFCKYFQLHDHEEFKEFMRMDYADYSDLYEVIGPKISKSYFRREPISSEIRFAVTIHYLGHGGSIKSVSLMFRIGKSTLYEIIHETCKAIAEYLLPEYIKLPRKEEWIKIANKFEHKWNFPNCLGALDGRHFRVQKPEGTGSLFYNYKKFFSLLLLATCDADKKFTWFNLGDYGSFSDSSAYIYCDLNIMLANRELDIPEPRKLPHSDEVMPFVFVCDEIFPLGENLMKPYSRRCGLGIPEQVFNYRLSRPRNVIECAFGELTARFQVLQSSLRFGLATTEYVISSCIGLHNYILTRNPTTEESEVPVQEGRDGVYVRNPAVVLRNKFLNYFETPEGLVSWQYDAILERHYE